LEIRQLRKSLKKSDEGENNIVGASGSGSPFPIVLNAPINGRITSLTAIQLDSKPTSLLFVTTDQHQYAVIGYDAQLTPHYIRTYASGSLKDEWNQLGQLSECGPLVTIDPYSRCIVLHLYDGLVTVFPIRNATVVAAGGGRAGRDEKFLGPVFHARLEERTVLAMTVLHHMDPIETPPHLCILHQDSRGAQHVTTHVVDLHNSQVLTQASYSVMAQQQEQRQSSSSSQHNNNSNIHIPPNACEWLKKSRLDGGSSLLIPVPPRQAFAAAAASATAAASTGNKNNKVNATSGGVVVVGQRQITYVARNHYKVLPIPPALILSWDALPPDASGMPRFLLGDEYGNLHMLTLITATAAAAAKGVIASSSNSDNDNKIVALQLDTLGSVTLANCLQYLDHGLVFCGSTLGDSQLVQIHDKPIPVEDQEDDTMNTGSELEDTTFLSVVEDYTHLGPIVDFDLVPMAGGGGADSGSSGGSSSAAPGQVGQSQVVTASGSSKSGSLRVIRNGIGMREYANVELSGIQSMWNLRGAYDEDRDTYLVQSFVGQTRVLGVISNEEQAGCDDDAMMDTTEHAEKGEQMRGDDDDDEYDDDVGGTLAEVVLPGIDSNASTLHITNIVGNFILQVTENQLRLATTEGEVLDTFNPEIKITVAAGNEAGQTVVALTGGKVLYFEVEGKKLIHRSSKQMDREVSCLNINPFLPKQASPGSMDISTGDEKMSAGRKAHVAALCAVGLWDDFTVRLLSLNSTDLAEVLQIHLSTEDDLGDLADDDVQGKRRNRNNMMARSLCLITLDFSSSSGSASSSSHGGNTASMNNGTIPGVNMLLVGLGDGTLVSFAVIEDGRVRVKSKKEVSLGTQRINLIPLKNERGGNCVLATGDRPTVIYLTGMGGVSERANYNPKLCYSNVNLSPVDEGESSDMTRPHAHESIVVNVAAPFSSPLLFDDTDNEHYSLCVADDLNLRMGVIDDIQKLHVTTYRLGMAPRRIVRCAEGRMFAVGCIESGIKELGIEGEQMAMGNCIRFLDDSTFDDIHRIDLEPTEMVLSMDSASLCIHQPSSNIATIGSPSKMEGIEQTMQLKSYLVVGTAYVLQDEDEPTHGRILIYSCDPEDNTVGDSTNRSVKLVTELQVRGGVYSICQFYEGKILATINSKTQLYKMVSDGTGVIKLSSVGVGHHGHILSLFVSSRAPKVLSSSAKTSEDGSKDKKADKNQKEMLAIVGDLMRSISLVQYYPQYETLEEVARDFNVNWTSAVTMLTDDVYLGGENWNNLFVLRRNTKAQSEEVRCRLDTVGEFHLGEMVNKFMSGSLVMPNSSTDTSKTNINGNRRRTLASPKKKSSKEKSNISSGIRPKRPVLAIGSQTLFGTVDGTLGVILGLDNATAAFFSCLEKSMEHVIMPIGNFSHEQFRAFSVEDRCHPRHGFVDGDLVESFLDFDLSTMERVVQQMNKDGSWTTSSSTSHLSGNNVDDANIDIGDNQSPQLCVDDVLAVIEEMTMLH
jgi:DNA damage-binding protein 1